MGAADSWHPRRRAFDVHDDAALELRTPSAPRARVVGLALLRTPLPFPPLPPAQNRPDPQPLGSCPLVKPAAGLRGAKSQKQPRTRVPPSPACVGGGLRGGRQLPTTRASRWPNEPVNDESWDEALPTPTAPPPSPSRWPNEPVNDESWDEALPTPPLVVSASAAAPGPSAAWARLRSKPGAGPHPSRSGGHPRPPGRPPIPVGLFVIAADRNPPLSVIGVRRGGCSGGGVCVAPLPPPRPRCRWARMSGARARSLPPQPHP